MIVRGFCFLTIALISASSALGQNKYVSAAEWYWDADPGQGNGNALSATDGTFDDAVESILTNSANIPLAQGAHTLHLRSADANGIWGPVFSMVVDVRENHSNIGVSYVKSAEYFFDTDPGEGNATPILAADGSFDQALEAIIGGAIPAPVAQGVHVLHIRPMDESNVWGPTFGIVVNMDTTLGAPPFSTMMSGETEICESDLPGTFTYTAAQHPGTTFNWNVSGGTITAGAGTNEVEITWDGAAPYAVEVVECDLTNTCDSVELFISVLNDAYHQQQMNIAFGDSAFLQGAWQTMGGTYYDTLLAVNGCDSIVETLLQVGSVGIGENGLSAHIYPNPVKNGASLTVQLNGTLQKPQLRVLDARGRCVLYRQLPTSDRSYLHIDLVPGMYYLLIDSEHRAIKHKLLVQ